MDLSYEARREAQASYVKGAVSHPVESIQRDWLRSQLETKYHLMGLAHGSHLPMQMKMEASILSQVRRLPGLPSSHIGLDTLLGRDTTIDFEDYLGDPRVSERAVDARAILEQRYGVAPRGAAAPSVGLAAAAGLPREGVAMRKEL